MRTYLFWGGETKQRQGLCTPVAQLFAGNFKTFIGENSLLPESSRSSERTAHSIYCHSGRSDGHLRRQKAYYTIPSPNRDPTALPIATSAERRQATAPFVPVVYKGLGFASFA